MTSARLHIAGDRTSVAPSPAGEGFVAAIGWDNIARDYLRHAPPTPPEMEAAITRIEDEIVAARAVLSGLRELETNDPHIREIAIAAGLADAGSITLDVQAVEAVFNRLANVASGSPSRSQGLSEAPQFAATLLILRELMHHLGFSSVTVRN